MKMAFKRICIYHDVSFTSLPDGDPTIDFGQCDILVWPAAHSVHDSTAACLPTTPAHLIFTPLGGVEVVVEVVVGGRRRRRLGEEETGGREEDAHDDSGVPFALVVVVVVVRPDGPCPAHARGATHPPPLSSLRARAHCLPAARTPTATAPCQYTPPPHLP